MGATGVAAQLGRVDPVMTQAMSGRHMGSEPVDLPAGSGTGDLRALDTRGVIRYA